MSLLDKIMGRPDEDEEEKKKQQALTPEAAMIQQPPAAVEPPQNVLTTARTPMNMPLEPGKSFAFMESTDPQRAAAAHEVRMGEIQDFSRSNPEIAYQRESAATAQRLSQAKRGMSYNLRSGVDPNIAAKLSNEMAMGASGGQQESFLNTSAGVFSSRDRGIVPGTAPATGMQMPFYGENVQKDGMWATWDWEKGHYKNWKPIPEGDDWLEYKDDPTTQAMLRKISGGKNLGAALRNLPQHGGELPAAPGQPAAPGGRPIVTSQAEYDALPPGTVYIENGILYTRQ